MAMTISEKIIANHSGKDMVEPGEFVESKVDIVLANDITAPIAIEELQTLQSSKVRPCSIPIHSLYRH